MKTKRDNEKAKERNDKLSHNILSTKSLMLTRVMPQVEPPRYSSSLSFSLPKVPTATPYWINNVKDDFYLPPNGFHLLRGFFPKNIIIPKQSFPTWSVYKTSFSELPTFQDAKSSLPISSCVLLSNCNLTLSYAGVLNSWSNFLQLGGHDVIQKYIKMTKDATLEGSSQQVNKDLVNRRNGQSPKHLKFFLLVFSKDEVQAN